MSTEYSSVIPKNHHFSNWRVLLMSLYWDSSDILFHQFWLFLYLNFSTRSRTSSTTHRHAHSGSKFRESPYIATRRSAVTTASWATSTTTATASRPVRTWSKGNSVLFTGLFRIFLEKRYQKETKYLPKEKDKSPKFEEDALFRSKPDHYIFNIKF